MNDGRLASIDTLLAVVDAGSFGGAARRLGLSQSTISRRVAQLEARLGVRLVARTTRNLSITPVGEAFVHQARRALSLLNAAEADLSAGEMQIAGLVRITAPTAFGRACLVPLLGELADAHPALKLDLELSDRYVDLQASTTDLAIRFSDDVPSGWRCERLGLISASVCASQDYLDKRGAPASPDDLSRHRILTVKTYNARTRWPFQTPKGITRFYEIDPFFVVSDFCTLTDLVLAGSGVSVLPSYLADCHLATGKLRKLLAGVFVFETQLYAARPVHLVKAARIIAIVQMLKRQLASSHDYRVSA